MIKKIYFILLISLFSGLLNAQTIEEFQVNFESGTYKLSNSEISKVNEILKSLKYKPKTCKIEIVGYTDNIGNIEYNQTLSKNRAIEISNYFVNNGFSKSKIKTKGENFNNPIDDNITEEGRAKNRRVSIKIIYDLEESLTINKFREKAESYTISINSEQKVTSKFGTKITIPENAFVDENGKTVTGEIEIRYQEYRKPIDFILSGIPMHIDNKGKRSFFNSAGMFNILAYKENKQVYLKKDKTIQIDYGLVKSLPNLNFYSLDSISKNWREEAKISDANGNRFMGILGCGNQNLSKEEKCPLYGCESLFYIQKFGIQYSNSDLSLFDQANYTNPTNFQKIQQTIQTNKEKMISINKRSQNLSSNLKSNPIRYQLSKINSDNKNIEFKIVELNNENAKNESFKKATYLYSVEKNKTIEESAFNKNWTTCTVQKSKNDTFFITLKDTLSPTFIYNLDIKTKKRVRKRKKAEFIDNLLTDMNQNSLEIIKTDSLKTDLITQKNKLISNNTILNNYRKGSENDELNAKTANSIECFAQYSRQIMPENESRMNTNTWLNYFDKNKKMMLERYSNMTENDKYKECIQKQIEAQKEQERLVELYKQSLLNNQKAIDLVQSFKISNLGIYNCDQIYYIENQTPLLAEYVLKNGTKINPNFIYLIDEKVNGILRFDANVTNYSPSKFMYNPKSKNTLLVFDEDGESYLFSSKKFKKLNTTDSTNKQLLVVEKIKNRKELETEFQSNL